jgi:hypothetical protein
MLEGPRVNGNHPAGVIAAHPTGWKIRHVDRSHCMIEAIVPSWLRATDQIELRLASVRALAIAVPERAGLIERIKLVATIDEGVARS